MIDDESDQATINTADPMGVADGDVVPRSAINDAIRRLLKQLPRAQYVGYTATPFANVFINPDDAEDVFPKDFIGSLERPIGYMGAVDFHDLEPERPSGWFSNETAHVRGVLGDDKDPTNLMRAIDSFVLAGMVKIYREKALGITFKHHTMLVHISQRVVDQRAIADLIEHLVEGAGYLGGDGMHRLETLWLEDFQPVSGHRAPDEPMPETFSELAPLVGECIQRLNRDVAQTESRGRSARVLILNGTTEASHPDFDRESIWKIVVGGAKLTRGYTVEGLTISYYRRRAGAADTLMQMGRWFGFRRNYQDLVRLFIGRHEPMDRAGRNHVDLYSAFEAVCRDELEFREQLGKYAKLEGEERITPKQLPPLVPAHYLMPTAKSKMFNAFIRFQNFSGEQAQKTVLPVDHSLVERNQQLLRELVAGSDLVRTPMRLETIQAVDEFDSFTALLSAESVVAFAEQYQWTPGQRNVIEREVAFLRGTGAEDPGIREWLFMAPQIESDKQYKVAGTTLNVIRRGRTATKGRYGVLSEPRHIRVAEYVAGVAFSGARANPDLKRLRQLRRGVFLFYPVSDRDENFVSMGFVLQFPLNKLPTRIAFSVRRPDEPEAVVVDATPGGAG